MTRLLLGWDVARQQDDSLRVAEITRPTACWELRERCRPLRLAWPQHGHGRADPAQALNAERLPLTAAIRCELLTGHYRRDELLGQRLQILSDGLGGRMIISQKFAVG